MASFAAHADFRPMRLEFIGSGIVVLTHIRGVAVRAHEVPILRWPGPMQLVVVGDPLIGVEVKPALAAVLLGARVPGNRERLQPAIRKLDRGIAATA